MTEMNACFRLASRYRRAMCSSEGHACQLRPLFLISGNSITSRIDGLFGQQHDQPVDADAFAGGRRQAVFERADVVLVHRVRLEIAAAPGSLSCASKRRRCSAGSLSSLKALATSNPPMYSSNRSTVSGSSGFCFDSGDTSVGKS